MILKLINGRELLHACFIYMGTGLTWMYGFTDGMHVVKSVFMALTAVATFVFTIYKIIEIRQRIRRSS